MKAVKIMMVAWLLTLLVAFIPVKFRPVSSSNIQFFITNAGVLVDGYFNEVVEAGIQFDPNNLDNSRIHARVSVESLKTGIAARDRHLMDEGYFHNEKYPYIEMVSTKFKKGSKGKYVGHFNLTIKGKTEKVKVPFSFSKLNNKVKFEGTFTINRLNYEVGESSFILSSSVKVMIALEDRLQK